MPLTKKEILKQLIKNNIDMGKNPDRTFIYYQEMGLLPKPIGMKKNAALYPDNTIDIIKRIKIFQKNGDSLPKIKEFLQVGREEAKKNTIKTKQNQITLVCKALGLKESEIDENLLLEKYGEFIKQLAMEKFKEKCEFLETGDTYNGLIKKAP